MEQPVRQTKLTAAEISQLWTTYMNDSAMVCILSHSLLWIENEEIKSISQHALELSQSHLDKLTTLFNKEAFAIPYGFSLQQDVDLTAPKLYSDTLLLHVLHNLGKIGLQAYSVSLSYSTREDVYSFFRECMQESDQLLKMSHDLLLNKGLYVRSPYLTYPERADFIKSQNFLQGYLGERRPLTALEVTGLYANFQRNAIGSSIMIGYSQTAQSKEVTKFLVRGKEIAQKHCEIFGSVLREDDLAVPKTWDTEVTDSTASTYSEKLMMFYTTSLIGLSMGYYGTSVAASPRRDLSNHYVRLIAEIGKYAEDGANIMIKHGWLEEPPKVLNRDDLSRKGQKP